MKRDIKGSSPFVVAVESTRMPMAFVDPQGPDHQILYANASFLKLMQHTNVEAVGKPFWHFIEGAKSTFSKVLTDCDNSKESTVHYIGAKKFNGEKFLAEFSITPILCDMGNIDRYFISIFEHQNQKDDDEEYQSRLRELYSHAPGFIATTTGPNHVITFANLAYFSLVGRRELIGLAVNDAFPEFRDQQFISILDNVYQTKRPFSGRRVPIDLVRTTGGAVERRYIDFIYQPIVDAMGTVSGLFCEGFDVTDFEEKEAELRALQSKIVELGRMNALGTMAATLAHELNQPLAALSNYAAGCITLFESKEDNQDQIAEGLRAIAMASDRAGQIIRRLRDMTRRAPPATELFDLTRSAVDSIQLVKAGSCCSISLARASSAICQVLADRIQVQQVIINLLKNACEAVSQSAEANVTVSITNVRDQVKVSVADTGSGVSPDRQKSLFAWRESEKPEGMGIGLSISRTIIENQGGRIWLERTSQKGSKFSFTLPRASKQF